MKYKFLSLIVILFLGCKTQKYLGLRKLQQIPLKTEILYKFNYHKDIAFLNGEKPKPDTLYDYYLFVNKNYKIELLESLPNKIKASYYITSISYSEYDNCSYRFSLTSKTNESIIASINKLGEISSIDMCPGCDANFVLNFHTQALTCCTHRNPQHCCNTPKEMQDTARKYGCVWE